MSPLLTLLPILLGTSETPPQSLHLQVRDSYLSQIPVLVRVELRTEVDGLARKVWDAAATLSAEGGQVEPEVVTLRNGIGSTLVRLTGEGNIRLTAAVGDLEHERSLSNLDASLPGAPSFSGELDPGLTVWDGIIRVTGDVRVPEDGILRVQPGAMVLVDGVRSGTDGVDIDVGGRMESLGTADRPVTFTASRPACPWGEIDHEASDSSYYSYTVITRGGNSPPGGHTDSGPMVRAHSGAKLVFESCTLSDVAGKILDAYDSDLSLRDCLLARAQMGPEIASSQLLFERGAIMEMYGHNDNDGIYLHRQQEHQTITLRQSIIASGDDDAIDTRRAMVRIEDCIIRDFADKGVSVTDVETQISGTVISGNGVGVAAATSQDSFEVTVNIDRSTILAEEPTVEEPVPVGIWAYDWGDRPNSIVRFRVRNSIIRAAEPIVNNYRAHPERISVEYTDVGGPDTWVGTGNFDAPPAFESSAGGPELKSGSPCVDAGDPAADLDPDQTRADQGAWPLDQVNCELKLRFSDPPEIVTAGEPITLRVKVANGCGQRLELDEVLFEVTGPVKREKVLYSGPSVTLPAHYETEIEFKIFVPGVARDQVASLCAAAFRGGERIATSCLQIQIQ